MIHFPKNYSTFEKKKELVSGLNKIKQLKYATVLEDIVYKNLEELYKILKTQIPAIKSITVLRKNDIIDLMDILKTENYTLFAYLKTLIIDIENGNIHYEEELSNLYEEIYKWNKNHEILNNIAQIGLFGACYSIILEHQLVLINNLIFDSDKRPLNLEYWNEDLCNLQERLSLEEQIIKLHKEKGKINITSEKVHKLKQGENRTIILQKEIKSLQELRKFLKQNLNEKKRLSKDELIKKIKELEIPLRRNKELFPVVGLGTLKVKYEDIEKKYSDKEWISDRLAA